MCTHCLIFKRMTTYTHKPNNNKIKNEGRGSYSSAMGNVEGFFPHIISACVKVALHQI